MISPKKEGQYVRKEELMKEGKQELFNFLEIESEREGKKEKIQKGKERKNTERERKTERGHLSCVIVQPYNLDLFNTKHFLNRFSGPF